MEQQTVIILNRNQLENAFHSLQLLSATIPGIFKKIGGMDEIDVKDCQRDLEIGASACVALIAVGDEMYAKNEQQKN